jgi:hypothetical protein
MDAVERLIASRANKMVSVDWAHLLACLLDSWGLAVCFSSG